MKAWAIVGYTYRGENYTPGGIVAALTPHGRNTYAGTTDAETMLDDLAEAAGIDRQDEHSFDSDDFPKVVFASQVEGDEAGIDAAGGYVPLVGEA